MKRLTLLKQTLAAACLLGCAQFASAAVISFDLDTTLANVADTFSVDLVWTGNAGEYLGDFDVDIAYDDAVVQYDGSAIDPQFAVDSLGCFDCGDFSVAGLIDIYEISFDFPADLMANQDGLGNSFVLATLEFTALAIGQTALALSGTFGDENGIGIDPALDNGRICVGPDGCGVAAVPTPESLPLVLFGLMAMGGLRLRKQRA